MKENIIHESLRLFSLKGFLGTSLQDILSAAGTSKGGFYNHFRSKEDLFYHVIDEARQEWRTKNLSGLDEIDDPVSKIIKLLENYRDQYLVDSVHFPGGCLFITLSVELNDQRPHLSQEISKGFVGLKNMIQRMLEHGKEAGQLNNNLDSSTVTEILFAGMLGASVIFGIEKSAESLKQSINALISYTESLRVLT
ncbi:MAG: TetR/AcrR family transcriptional regulator [Deltaproteobacteria bacterium]|nr:TetR/AcrR family transcriptional regulator [Deltaproteobacteria bacterium]